VWEHNGSVTFDPDIRVQEMVHLIFRKFRELGSARQVLMWMRHNDVHCPRPSSTPKSTGFQWSLPRYRTIISVLKNPFYAGVYVYGKSEHRTEIVDGRPRRSYGHSRPREEWAVFLRNHHEGYIEWPEYERNQEALARNNFRRPGTLSKSARGGRALLAGLLHCGHCGLRLQVVYCGRRPGAPRYRCDRPQLSYGLGRCLTFGAWAADRAIAQEALRAVEPMGIEAATEAEKQIVERRAAERHVHELELEQARYDAQLAERRYAACDPGNRLVAAQLERHWEQAMSRVRVCEEKVGEFDGVTQEVVPAAELEDLALDLEAAWRARTTTMRTRQRLLRALIEDIIVTHDQAENRYVLVVRWKGGQHTQVPVRRLKSGEHQFRASEEALEVIRRMAGNWPDDQIAATLNRLGLRTGQDNTWDLRKVQAVRRTHDIRAYKSAYKDGDWVTMSEAAQKLGVTNHVIRYLIRNGLLPAEQVVARAPYQIRAGDLESEAVRKALASGGPYRGQGEQSLPLFPTS
jgi:hypothetical protein